MRISIVIPTFNRAKLLIDTLRSALTQDYKDLEIIISDNASTDNTFKVLQEYLVDPRVKYFRNSENIGMVPNWRKAVFERATGDWFLLLSDDDVLISPHFLSRAARLIQENQDIQLVYSNAYIYDEAFNKVSDLVLPFNEVEDGITVFSQRGKIKPQDFALCGVLFPRLLSKELNAFANQNNLSCDTELFLKLCLRGKVGVIDEYCSIYRMHSGNLLKSASKNLDLVVGSLDSLINPLNDAYQRGLPQEQLRTFLSNSGIEREILICLLKVATLDRGRASQLKKELRAQLSDLPLNILPSKWLLKFLIQLGPFAAPLFWFRKKVLYFLNSLYFKLLADKVTFLNLFLGTPCPNGVVSLGVDAPKVAIALATYNPQYDFFVDQVASLKGQTYKNWQCILVDDFSDEKSFQKILEVIGGDPRFEIHRNQKNMGSFKTFERALSLLPLDAEFVCFCDQDDIWTSTKIQRQIEVLSDPSISLVHTDQSLIDKKGKVFASSCWTMEGRNIPEATTDLLLFRNLITGCTTMFRRKILNTALPFFDLRPKSEMYHHDMWIAMHACIHGRVVGMRESLVLYRQHGGNLVGVSSLRKNIGLSDLGARAYHAFRERCGLREDFLLSLQSNESPMRSAQKEQLSYITSIFGLLFSGVKMLTLHPSFFRVWIMLFVGHILNQGSFSENQKVRSSK